MPHLLSLAKDLQSLLDMGSVVPSRLRAHFDDRVAQEVERTIRALSAVATQRHQDGRASGQSDAVREEQEAVFSEIAINMQTIRFDLFLTSEEVVRRTVLVIRFARTALNADEQLAEHLGPGADRFFQQLDTMDIGEGRVGS